MRDGAVTGSDPGPWLWFGLVLVGAVALRLWNLGGWDMWTDEVQTLWVSQSGEFQEGPMYRTAPVNFFLTGWAVAVAGADAFGARLVSFLSGSLTVALFFLLMRRWIGDRAALFGTLLLALSFWHVGWSQTARHFALQTLVLLGVLHFFLRFWRTGGRGSLVVTSALLLLAHFVHSSSGFFLAGLGLFVVLEWMLSWSPGGGPDGKDDGLRRHAWALAGLAAVLAVYLPVYLWVASYLLEHKRAWNPPFNLVGSLAFYLSPILTMFAAAGAVCLYREKDDLWLLLSCLAVVPPVLAVAASAFTIASGAYALPALLAFAALAGVLADRLLARAADGMPRFAVAALVAGLFLSQAYELAHYYFVWNGLKPHWSEAVTFVEERREPGERLWASEGDVAQYYAGRDRAGWFGRYRGSMSDEQRGAEGASGDWFILYLDADQLLLPWQERRPSTGERVPEGASVEAIFPLHYGAKNRTLVVYHTER